MKTIALLAPPGLLVYGAYQLGLLPLKTSNTSASSSPTLEEMRSNSNQTVFKFSKRPMSWIECNPRVSPLSRYLLEESDFTKLALVRRRKNC